MRHDAGSLAMVAFALLTLQAGCASSAESAFLENGVTAHRGNSSEYPENTMPAFRSALALGVDWIEMDLHRTLDGRIVVIHDADTGRVGDRKVEVAKVTYDELRKVDVAYQFRKSRGLALAKAPRESVPLLGDVLALVMTQTKTRVSLEPKVLIVPQAIALIRRMRARRWVAFNADPLEQLRNVKELEPEIPVFWDTAEGTEENIRIARKLGFRGLVMNRGGITRDQVARIRKAGLEAGVYTVNDPGDMTLLMSWGVDRIYTDRPRELLRLKSGASLPGGR
ncbi:MAG: hypothetical protein HY235_17085 [Acidobacteria bacterium]|nr:hypothetical protein [Acidobacteriota bacterium]